jgi:hypothetical protein
VVERRSGEGQRRGTLVSGGARVVGVEQELAERRLPARPSAGSQRAAGGSRLAASKPAGAGCA